MKSMYLLSLALFMITLTAESVSMQSEIVQKEIELCKNSKVPLFSFSPLSQYYEQDKGEHVEEGQKALRENKVGLILLAGGLGSRLGKDVPKGTLPISPVRKKSLFQMFSERVLEIKNSFKAMPKLAIMTSQDTHEDTLKHFKENNYFGLQESEVSFFKQSSLPLLDENFHPILQKDNTVLYAPDGNGSLFWSFSESGLLDSWKNQGIAYISVCNIDNPLADPFDYEMIGLLETEQVDFTCGCIKRDDPFEKVGVIVQSDKIPRVVEYSEISEVERTKKNEDGTFMHPLANVSIYSFSTSFIERLSQLPKDALSLHRAEKNCTPKQKMGLLDPFLSGYLKFEYFIFDVFPYAKSGVCLVYDRDRYFHPLKNGTGVYSPKSVEEALIDRDRRIYLEVFKKSPRNDLPIELSPSFYYLLPEKKEMLKTVSVPDFGYIEIPQGV